MLLLGPLAAPGLSPRVRGNRSRRGSDMVLRGSIPACAGEPTSSPRTCRSRWVYPRVCGGTAQFSSDPSSVSGLSPRVRGNPDRIRRRARRRGSIPACAGEPRGPFVESGPHRVYPRVCGGTPSDRCSRMTRVRSIPACAGEPWPRAGSPGRPWVYPRVCGGTASRPTGGGALPGLSPRVRGNPADEAASIRPLGSIPACAGEPAPKIRSCNRSRVYPRVCGGTSPLDSLSTVIAGLSPRVRGNLRHHRLPPLALGSIPACAGEPRPHWRARSGSGVYPRVCGGTITASAVRRSRTGLSPRVRGNPSPRGPVKAPSGSIPACAGEPLPGTENARVAGVYPRVCGGTPCTRAVWAR